MTLRLSRLAQAGLVIIAVAATGSAAHGGLDPRHAINLDPTFVVKGNVVVNGTGESHDLFSNGSPASQPFCGGGACGYCD